MKVVKEKILLLKIRTKKDTEAFAKLYDFYVEPIYRFVYFKLSNKEDAEDITSEIFLKAWDYLMWGEKEVNNFRRLIYRIARNLVIDVYRKRAGKQECPIEFVQNIVVTEDLKKIVEVSEEVEEMLANLKKLKQEYQDVIHLKYIEGLPIKEIAAILDKNSTNVRVTLHRAVKKLKDLTEPKNLKS